MAQKGVNKVILIGNVGQDPDIRFTPSGTAVANLSIATSENWKDQQGQQQEKTEWHRVVIFGKLAEICQQYVHKGAKIYIEGKLQTRKWQGNDGQDRYTTEVVVDGFGGVMQMLDSKQQGQPQRPQAQQRPGNHPAQQAPQNYQQQAPQGGGYQGADQYPDDPF